MRVILLSERDYQLCKAKIEQEYNCVRLNSALMRRWEKENGCQWHAHKWIRKRAVEAARLKRIFGL